jgi:uncharacterized protein YhaN
MRTSLNPLAVLTQLEERAEIGNPDGSATEQQELLRLAWLALVSTTNELTRLRARVAELEAENVRLNKHIATNPVARVGATVEVVNGRQRAMFIEDWKARAESAERERDELRREIERLRKSTTEARDVWADQLEADLRMCCPIRDGKPVEEEMDEYSRPMIEETRALIARLDAALTPQEGGNG